MKKTKTLKVVILTVFSLTISAHAWSTQKTEPQVIDKKDVVDEVNRSEIEKNESSEAPKIDNIIPAFEMPSFKTNVKKSSNKKSTTTKRMKPKPEIEKKQDKAVESASSRIVEKKPPPRKVVETNKKIETKKTTVKPKKHNKRERKKSTVVMKKTLKVSQLLVNDTVSLVKNRLVVQRLKGKYIYQYRFKSSLPLDSKGLEKTDENHYLVVDKQLLIADVEKHDKANNTEKNQEISDEVLSKRKVLERKYNKGRQVSLVIPVTKLNKGDVIYVFGEVQMVTRNYTGRVSTKKYWLFPTIDVNNPALLKTRKGKYKVVKKVL